MRRAGWAATLRAAAPPHQVMPELCRLLLRAESHAAAHEEAALILAEIRRHHAAQKRERDAVLEALDARGVQPILLKGAAYHALGLGDEDRESADTDLLFRSLEDSFAATALLLERGHRATSTLRLLGEPPVAAAHEMRRESDGVPLAFGLYWGALPAHPPDLLDENVPELLAGRAPEDFLLAGSALPVACLTSVFLLEITATGYYRLRDLLDWGMLRDFCSLHDADADRAEVERRFALAPVAAVLDEVLADAEFGRRDLEASPFGRPSRIRSLPRHARVRYHQLRRRRGPAGAAWSASLDAFRALLWRGLGISGPRLRAGNWRRRFLQGPGPHTYDVELRTALDARRSS